MPAARRPQSRMCEVETEIQIQIEIDRVLGWWRASREFVFFFPAMLAEAHSCYGRVFFGSGVVHLVLEDLHVLKPERIVYWRSTCARACVVFLLAHEFFFECDVPTLRVVFRSLNAIGAE